MSEARGRRRSGGGRAARQESRANQTTTTPAYITRKLEPFAVLDDAACMIGCPRSCLNVVAADKGLVVGRLQFREDGDLIDCTRMGVTGKAIPV